MFAVSSLFMLTTTQFLNKLMISLGYNEYGTRRFVRIASSWSR